MARSKANALPNDDDGDDDDSHVRPPCARGPTSLIRWHAQHRIYENAQGRLGGERAAPVLSSDTFNTQPQQHSIAFLCTNAGRHTQAREHTHRCAPSIVNLPSPCLPHEVPKY